MYGVSAWRIWRCDYHGVAASTKLLAAKRHQQIKRQRPAKRREHPAAVYNSDGISGDKQQLAYGDKQ